MEGKIFQNIVSLRKSEVVKVNGLYALKHETYGGVEGFTCEPMTKTELEKELKRYVEVV